MKKTLIALGAGVLAMAALTGCSAMTETDSATVSENLSLKADMFEIDRRIVFYNGITDTYLLTIEGRCAIEDEGNQLEVTCKIGPDAYKKHFLGLSDNVTYMAEQLADIDVSEYHHLVIFKPEAIIPEVEIHTKSESGN